MNKVCKWCKYIDLYLTSAELHWWCTNNLSNQYFIDDLENTTCEYWKEKK